MIKKNSWTLAAIASAALAACGGGGSDTAAAPPAAASVTIAGTAAKGVALAGATVSVKCAAGTGSATTGSDGKYTVTITGASLPCALRVVGTEGSVFHSVVSGSGGSGNFAANITPFTEMLLAKVAGAAPGAFFDGFNASTPITAAQITAAIDYLKTAVAGTTDLAGVNPVTDALTVGNPLDQKIDALMAALTSAGTTLAQVAATIVANPAAPNVVATPLAPPAPDCAWLRRGNYRMINPYETVERWKAHVLNIDAVARTALDQDNTTITFTSDGNCQYTVDGLDFTNKVMVSASGVLVVHSQSKTNTALRTVTIGLPEQSVPISELAGTWNVAGWGVPEGATTPGRIAQSREITLNSAGQIASASICQGLAACTTDSVGPFSTISANATSGGFNLTDPVTGAANGRAFLFKNLAGKAAFVVLSPDGSILVGSRKESLGALPSVGSVSNFREFSLNGNGTVSTLLDQSVTVTATDATANTATRLRASDSRVDMIGFDKPRNGLRYRAPNSCTVNNVASNCSETVQLPLQGMGITLSMSVATTPASAFYSVSVGKPN